MAKLTKIVNGEYIGGNKYKITSTGDGKSTIDFSPDTVLTPGTPVGAEVLNEIQKNGLYTLIGTKRVVGQEDIYDCTFEGIENFDFEEINILLKPNANSTMQNVFVNVGGSKYKITSILGTHCNIFANQNIGLTLKKSTLQAIKWDMSDDTKLPKGSLPVTVPDGKTIYDMLENNGGINIDTALLYLNDAGTKTAGKVYFDKNKKGLFECIKTTTNTVNSTEFFVDISNKASADRLTNLFKSSIIARNINSTTEIDFSGYNIILIYVTLEKEAIVEQTIVWLPSFGACTFTALEDGYYECNFILRINKIEISKIVNAKISDIIGIKF